MSNTNYARIMMTDEEVETLSHRLELRRNVNEQNRQQMETGFLLTNTDPEETDHVFRNYMHVTPNEDNERFRYVVRNYNYAVEENIDMVGGMLGACYHELKKLGLSDQDIESIKVSDFGHF